MLDIEVEEADARALAGEGADDLHADARRSAGHDDARVPKTGIRGEQGLRGTSHLIGQGSRFPGISIGSDSATPDGERTANMHNSHWVMDVGI